MITGGHRGLGSTISTTFAKAGCQNIIIIDRNGPSSNKEGSQTASTISQYSKHWSFQADLSDPSQITKVTTEILKVVERVDILVNNAGIALLDSLTDLSLADWNKVLAINLTAPYLLSQAFVPQMISNKRGKIINIGSVAGQCGLSEHGAYSASKSGLEGLTRVMAAEWGKYNIQCNTIAPTVVMTEMGKRVWGGESNNEKSEEMLKRIPMRRFGESGDVAEVALFLASNASGFICGQTIAVDGGYTAV